MINYRHHERRQLGDMIWYDLEERRTGDDRRAIQAKKQLSKLKFKSLASRVAFHVLIACAILAWIGLIILGRP